MNTFLALATTGRHFRSLLSDVFCRTSTSSMLLQLETDQDQDQAFAQDSSSIRFTSIPMLTVNAGLAGSM